MKVSVDYLCEACGAIGEGWRDKGDAAPEDCWNCGEPFYYPHFTGIGDANEGETEQ